MASASAALVGTVSNAVGETIKRTSKTIRPKPKKVKPDIPPQVSGPISGTGTVFGTDEVVCQNDGIQACKQQTLLTETEPVYCDPELFVKRQIRRTDPPCRACTKVSAKVGKYATAADTVLVAVAAGKFVARAQLDTGLQQQIRRGNPLQLHTVLF